MFLLYFNIMNRYIKGMTLFYIEYKLQPKIINELDENPKLKNLLSNKINSFISWTAKQRLNYCADINQEVIDFLNADFGENRVRLYNYNVKLWYKTINQVFKRDNYTCQYCGAIGGKLEADHIIPFSKGGSDELNNLTTSCQKCNRQKKDKYVNEFISWRKNKYEKN